MNTTDIVKTLRNDCRDRGSNSLCRNGEMNVYCAVGDAADRLEELLDRCARYAEEIAVLRERQRWIPVTERLPENGQRVLAYCKDRVIHDAKWSWPESEWFDKATGSSYLGGFVTHWMPLPPAPEVE